MWRTGRCRAGRRPRARCAGFRGRDGAARRVVVSTRKWYRRSAVGVVILSLAKDLDQVRCGHELEGRLRRCTSVPGARRSALTLGLCAARAAWRTTRGCFGAVRAVQGEDHRLRDDERHALPASRIGDRALRVERADLRFRGVVAGSRNGARSRRALAFLLPCAAPASPRSPWRSSRAPLSSRRRRSANTWQRSALRLGERGLGGEPGQGLARDLRKLAKTVVRVGETEDSSWSEPMGPPVRACSGGRSDAPRAGERRWSCACCATAKPRAVWRSAWGGPAKPRVLC
jgi:hypothetical protein